MHTYRIHALAVIFRLALLGICGSLLAACPDADRSHAQEAVFIALLQKNILEKKGIRFSALTEEQKKAVGPYGRQYELLNSLSEDEGLLGSFSGLPALQQKLIRSTDPAEKKILIAEASANMLIIKEKLITAYKKARDRKAALQQPEEVKSVYDEAFLKVVQAPTDLLVSCIEQGLEAVESAMALNEYLLKHPDAARYQGTTVLIEKPEAEADIRRLFEAYRESSERALQTVRELNELTW